MLDHIGISVSNYERSKSFYLKALAPIGYRLLMEVQGFAGFGLENGGGAIASFWIHEDQNKVLPGCHVAFTTHSREQVDDFYKSAISAGGQDNGKPGLREIYHPNYYGAFVLDPDGYNIEAVYHYQPVDIIRRQIKLKTPPQEAYELFVNKFGQWWPKAYTWSQDKLLNIIVEPKPNGRCYEEGPNGFLCQFGSVLKINPGVDIEIAWQIGPNSQPQPDPENASNISISFKENGANHSILEFEHSNIDNHGDGASQYFQQLNSEYGWDWVLNKYQQAIESKP